jgi:hypothetical protein
VNDREYSLPDWRPVPADRVTFMRYWLSVLGIKEDKNSGFNYAPGDYPPGFFEAVRQYTDMKVVFRSEMFEGLRKWRECAKRDPKVVPPCRVMPPSTDDRDAVEYFKDLILYALFYGQKDILQALLDVLTEPPDEPDMHSVRAVIAAFRDLFKGGSEDDWPLKKQVRERAIEILKEADSPIPKSSSEWARIFRKAALSELRNATRRSTRARIG